MEEGETVSILSRKELRKQKLMEYLAAKGKLKQSNPKPHVRDDSRLKRPVTSAFKAVTGKENKAPPDPDYYECTKVPSLAAQSIIHPARGICGASDKVNGKSSTLIRKQKINDPPAVSDPVQPKLTKNPALTRIHTIPSSKSSMNAACHLKKQPNTGIQSSGRASSHAPQAAVSKSNGRFSTSSSAAWSRPVLTVSVRMSLGPIVKTKTGLVPAVTQPRHSQSQNLIHTSVANQVRSSTMPSLKRSTKAQGETLRTTTRNNPVNQRATIASTGRAGAKDQNKFNSKPLLGKHSQSSCKSLLQKSTSGPSKCSAAPLKPNGTAGVSKASRSGGQQHTDRPMKLRCEGAGEKNGQPRKVASQTSSGPESRSSSRAVGKVLQGAAADLGAKTKTCQRMDSRKGHGSANPPPPPQTAIKRTVAPLMSQTVPRPTRTISLTGRATDMKTPKVPVRVIPQTEGKRLTADQEERMKKLQEWRQARGICYKRPPMPVKSHVRRTVAVPQPFWATMKDEDEAHSLICAVDRSLADCIKLLGEGCSPDQVKEVISRLPPVSQKFAKYWICQARLMEQEGNLDVLPMFEEAVGVVLEPVDELRTVVFEILKKKDEIQENENEEDRIPAGESTPESIDNPMMTPKPVRALICGEKGDSSVVKYKITATPSGPPSQQRQPVRVNGQEVRFFTPVRRSVRIERASLRYPASLQDHDLCVASYDDLISEEVKGRGGEEESGDTSPSASDTPMYVYRENEALKEKVLVRLVCDEGV